MLLSNLVWAGWSHSPVAVVCAGAGQRWCRGSVLCVQSPALIYLTPFTPCSSLLAQSAPCAGGRAELLNHSLLGRSEGSTPCYLFFERSLIFPCFWFWQCHYYLLLRSSFFALPMLCSEETNTVVFFLWSILFSKKSILWMYLTADSECNIKKWTH